MIFSTAPVVDTSHDDWATYAHDYTRTAMQHQATGITTGNVAALKLRWHVKVPTGGGYASPLVVAGTLYGTGSYGTVVALSAQNGSTRWTRVLQGNFAGNPILATPTLAGGVLYVVEHYRFPSPSYISALRATDGVVLWRKVMGGPSHASPVVVNGTVLSSFSQSDDDNGEPVIQGGIRAYRASDEAVLWTWYVDGTRTNNGGGSWGTCAQRNRNIYCGTSNTYYAFTPAQESIVTLDVSTGHYLGRGLSPQPPTDDDFGGGAMINGNTVFAQSKSGTFWGFPMAGGALACHTYLGAPDGLGGVAAPTTDGSTILVGGGIYGTNPQVPTTGKLFALNAANCGIKWSMPLPSPMRDYAALVPGLGLINVNNLTQAFDINTGKALWSYAGAAAYRNAPTVVPSGVYVEAASGDTYAFR